ncbi:MAG: CHAT domain-containing protein [Pyrinomonadaceae bacterium]
MSEKTRLLFLSANPWTTARILVDDEVRESFEKLQEGPYRDHFELRSHVSVRPIDLQRLLMMYRPHIVHFCVHGSKSHKLILAGTPGRGKEIDRAGLANLFSLYSHHVRLVFLNACFTREQAITLSEVIDYSIGTGKGIGDKGGVAFAAAFYRALSFGKSVQEAFRSAKVELGITKTRRTSGIELFVRDGIGQDDSFPQIGSLPAVNELRNSLTGYGDLGNRVPREFLFNPGEQNQSSAGLKRVASRCADDQHLLPGNDPFRVERRMRDGCRVYLQQTTTLTFEFLGAERIDLKPPIAERKQSSRKAKQISQMPLRGRGKNKFKRRRTQG